MDSAPASEHRQLGLETQRRRRADLPVRSARTLVSERDGATAGLYATPARRQVARGIASGSRLTERASTSRHAARGARDTLNARRAALAGRPCLPGDRRATAGRRAWRHRAGGRFELAGWADERRNDTFSPVAAVSPPAWTEDAPTKVLAPRAKVSVGLTVTTIAEQTVDLSLYGPGDVIGVDPRMIVRTDPRPLSADVEPNYMPLIEFDPPDFPWMFTPARADTQTVASVVRAHRHRSTDRRAAPKGAPLPDARHSSERPARELPDLAESWAWVHTQLLTDVAAPDACPSSRSILSATCRD